MDFDDLKLTPSQLELLKLAKKKGFLTFDDFDVIYTSPISVKRNIRRFKLLGLIKETNTFGKFEYIGEK